MIREEARAYVNGRIGTELTKAKKRIGGYDTYVCPFCGNGSGKDGTGMSTRDGIHYKCFKCDYSGDYLDILKRQRNTEHEGDIFSLYNLEIDGSGSPTRQSAATLSAATRQSDPQPPADCTEFYREAHKALVESHEAISYLQGRAISIETASRFMLGFCPEWRSPAALRAGKNPPPSRRLIIPTSKTGYTARDMDPNGNANFRFLKEGEAGYFGRKALQGTEPVFIVEGAIDALSVYEVGGAACALGSTSGVDKFLALIERERPAVPLVLALDNDEAGRKAQSKLKAGLEVREISFYEANISGECKDPNENLQLDRTAFMALVESGPAEAARQEAEAVKAAYRATASAFHVNAFMGAVAESASTPAISTGFNRLDDALDDGLYAGLYIMGALSSLGKTTLALQIADQIAQNGHDVLIFSLEMSRYELMAKSISRLTLENCNGNLNAAKTTRGILAGKRWQKYNDIELDLIDRSLEYYRRYSDRIFIHEGVGSIGAAQIVREVYKHEIITGNAPVVFIDYLQILAPHDERATDKQNVDRAVLELKRLSRDKKIPVIAISSFNRDNYTSPVNMASFKESGAVEYSSDVLIGLQLAGMDELSQADTKRAETIRRIEEMKADDPRKAQLKILKNRNGKTGMSLYFDYYPMFNSFRETDDPDTY